MANVMFKRGLQASLPQGNSIVDGTFYLTTDTQRLFVGQGSSLIPLCETVQVKENWAAVQASAAIEGQFYYAAAENILCIYKGSQWIQINPDTKISSVATTVTGTDKATITFTITNNTGDSVKHEFTLTEGAGINFTINPTTKDVKFDVNVDSLSVTDKTDNSVDITLGRSLDGIDDDVISVKGGNAKTITVDASGDVITITPVVGTDNDNLGTHGADIKGVANAFDANGGFKTTLTKNAGDTIASAVVTPTVKYGEGYAASATFKNGVAELDVYTTKEVDDLFVGLNAMIYRGVTADPSKLTNVHNGDLYLIKGAPIAGIEIGGERAYDGDVIIAQGTEGTDGVISGTVTWVIVPSANEIDSTFKLVAKATNTVELQNQNGEGQGSFSIVGDNTNINVALTGTQFTVSHAGPGTGSALSATAGAAVTQDALSTKAFTAITGLEKDSFGHITGATKQTFTVTDTSVVKTTTAMTANVANNVATVGVNAKAFNTGNEEVTSTGDSIGVSSSTLTMSAATDGFAIDLTWGEF